MGNEWIIERKIMKKLEEYNKNRNNNLKTDYDDQLIVHYLIER